MGKLIVDIIAKVRLLCAGTEACHVSAMPAQVCLTEYQPGFFENMTINSIYFGPKCELVATNKKITFINNDSNETVLFEYNGWFDLLRM